uniref:Uncharacterized protein n=1 Tax=Globisporangium ultimum (strain ATCC 200006 / CBS 805.95 / DAOM BR144) TaxID=431595 RepID=K3WZ04_GLOUD
MQKVTADREQKKLEDEQKYSFKRLYEEKDKEVLSLFRHAVSSEEKVNEILYRRSLSETLSQSWGRTMRKSDERLLVT